MTKSLHSQSYNAFLQVLVKARQDKGLTQQSVADVLGKPQSYVAKIEGGERRVDVVEFIELAKAMGSDPETLFVSILEKASSIEP